ncbi:CBO0543 family protein [Bacillus sp. FJAT-27251]|uniref:CBO0543 family protein n=1 Tax=Bacillus sp. FJAT-27251 TaxID=1684142 RepID=UPI0006A76A71|nr:CBO0543 family protein [Bacillus sp. FJAT-27251]
MNALYALVWIGALWKWGDWRNWRLYYPTLLFLLLGDFLYQYLLVDHYPMWKYTPQGMDAELGLTHTHIFLSIMLVKYPATVMIYLSKFPKERLIKQVLYILFWIGIYSVNEFIDLKTNLMTHEHGWSLGWSVLFNTVMFIVLKIHFHKPPAAWVISILFILFLWNMFDVPGSVFR